MKYSDTALRLIPFQNDYFSPSGILYSVIEENKKVTDIFVNTTNSIADFVKK